ncbi:MAG TPA: GNAT family N-acetyltransferase [Candidatus Sulfotelmatobacter sp.]|nr:GNAT family N-acetyltransferase [Candidatus Sulfotelmatobacter sp.]
MRIVVADHIAEDPGLRDAWHHLVLQMEEPEIFYTFEWAMAVQQAYSSSLKPFIFLGYEAEALVAVVALAQRSNGEIAFLSADTGDYCDFVSDRARRDEFVSAVVSELECRGISRIVLTNLPEDSASLNSIQRIAQSGTYHLHTRPAYACAQVVLGSNDHRLALKQSLTGKKSRRRMREMQKRGEVSVLHETEAEKIQALLEPFSHAHVARFLENGKMSSLLRAERRNFLQELTKRTGQHGWVVMSRLLVGGVTAAWHFGFCFCGTWFWYQPTVNALYSDCSPGYSLLSKIVELACDFPQLDTVDLGLGAESYKDRLATSTRQTLYCVLSDSLAKHVREIVRYRTSVVATSSARVERTIRAMISCANTLKSKLRTTTMQQFAGWGLRRIKHAISACDDMLFFEWSPTAQNSCAADLDLVPLDADLLGAAAIRYVDDPDAMQYLTRSAQRFRSQCAEGFALLDSEGVPVHFCWVRPHEGFEMAELSRKLQAPSMDSVIIFDCYTPAAARGSGLFSRAIALLARRLSSEGKRVWVFGAKANQSSLREIKKTEFVYRFTLGRKTRFFVRTNHDSSSEESLLSPGSKPLSTNVSS